MMDADGLNQRLSRISTVWAVLREAHAGIDGGASAAQQALLDRYGGAAYRYLLAALGDPDAAEELWQELAVRFLRGDFRGAAPERGRFRDYLKTALIHLIRDRHRARQRWPGPLPGDAPAPAAPPEGEDDGFLASWREDLLARTWRALERDNAAYHATLRCRADNPDLSSPDLAQLLSAQLGRPVTAPWVRKTLQRAQGRFAALLLDEVAGSLAAPSAEGLRDELTAVGLMPYCRSALARRG
jgi:DNA-directed RNA polymerase specialized sigma24 family protein